MSMRTITANFQRAGNVHTVTRGGVEYLVAPVVLLKEGVYRGSGGAVRYSRNALESSVSQWEGIPITAGHPMDREGPISVQDAAPRRSWAGSATSASRTESSKAMHT